MEAAQPLGAATADLNRTFMSCSSGRFPHSLALTSIGPERNAQAGTTTPAARTGHRAWKYIADKTEIDTAFCHSLGSQVVMGGRERCREVRWPGS